LNLQQDSTQTYAACPYCLTRIDIEETGADEKEEKEQLQVISDEKSIKTKEKPLSCQFHLGYLSEREQKQQIPEDCIICKDIVECMLRKMRT
jgi:uncharacterized Zn-finger protein